MLTSAQCYTIPTLDAIFFKKKKGQKKYSYLFTDGNLKLSFVMEFRSEIDVMPKFDKQNLAKSFRGSRE